MNSNWIFVALGTLLAFLGLMVASHTQDTGYYIHGLLVAAFGVGLNFWLIGHWEAKPQPQAH